MFWRGLKSDVLFYFVCVFCYYIWSFYFIFSLFIFDTLNVRLYFIWNFLLVIVTFSCCLRRNYVILKICFYGLTYLNLECVIYLYIWTRFWRYGEVWKNISINLCVLKLFYRVFITFILVMLIIPSDLVHWII